MNNVVNFSAHKYREQAGDFYAFVYKHLIDTRGWAHSQAEEWMLNKSWRLVLRVSNLLKRQALISRSGNVDVRPDGSIWVYDTWDHMLPVCLRQPEYKRRA